MTRALVAVLAQVRRAGWSIRVDGENLRLRYKAGGKPGPDARAALEALRPLKTEALSVLRVVEAVKAIPGRAIESFKAHGIEVGIDVPNMGCFWLVPTHTPQARIEITPEELCGDPLGAILDAHHAWHALRLFGGRIVRVLYDDDQRQRATKPGGDAA